MSQSQGNADESGSPLQRGGARVSGTGSGCRSGRQARNANIALAGGEVCDPWVLLSPQEPAQVKWAELSTEELKHAIPVCKLVAELETSSSLWFVIPLSAGHKG